MSGSSGRDLRRLAPLQAPPVPRRPDDRYGDDHEESACSNRSTSTRSTSTRSSTSGSGRVADGWISSRQRSRLRRMPGAMPVGHVQVRHCEQLKDVEARAQGVGAADGHRR